MLRKASAHWQGSTNEGTGTLSTQSATLKDTPYSFKAPSTTRGSLPTSSIPKPS